MKNIAISELISCQHKILTYNPKCAALNPNASYIYISLIFSENFMRSKKPGEQ